MYSTIKRKPCKECGSMWHTAMYHKPRKPIAVRKPLPRATKPIRREAVKTREKRLATTAAWLEANPPDKNGHWRCYISKHPQCPKVLTRQTIVLEHNLSKVRRKDLRYDIKNIFPACSYDNAAKGSLSAEEYMNNAQPRSISI